MLLIYGCTGYTGWLVAEEARGTDAILAGRNAEKVRTVAGDRPMRVFEATVPDLTGVKVVLNCAGPFTRMAGPLVDACIRERVHYVDITGEIGVFAGVHARDAEARAAGVMLLPGAGFDVVPTDCLALHLKQRLPSATRLTLAIAGSGGISHGTMTSMLDNLATPDGQRIDGKLVFGKGFAQRRVDYGDGKERIAVRIPWGDLYTAYVTTGIPTISTWAAMSPALARAMWWSRFLLPLLETKLVRGILQARVDAMPEGPTEEQRHRGWSRIWGEVEDDAGGRASARLVTPEGYLLTSRTAVEIARRALAGDAPAGFQTPGTAYGADFVLGFAGVRRNDES